MTEAQARGLSPLTLAFLGDSVYETMVREKIAEVNMPAAKLHNASIAFARASFQAWAYDLIGEILEASENDIMRRGRNAGSNNVPKSSNPIEYHKATGLETLFGYLHLCKKNERMKEIFEYIMNNHGDKTVN